jgi:small subunit ribosomal protein S5
MTDSEQFIEKLVSVNRVTKVVKGGRIMSFVALVVVGDGRGKIGMGKVKSKEVSIAVQRATREAKKNLISVYLNNTTIQHEIKVNYGATKVYMQPAKDGHGVIAGGAMRAVFEAVGVKNITAKAFGSTNPYSIVRATIKALSSIMSPQHIAQKRGKQVSEIFG